MSTGTLDAVRHEADTYSTRAARAACPWLSVDESLGLPGWVLESLHEADARTIRGRLLNMSDRYFASVLTRRLTQLDGGKAT